MQETLKLKNRTIWTLTALSFRLEERRKVKGQAYYERKTAARKALADAKTNANIDEKTKTQLAEYGY
nr:60s ribosomal protein l16 [Quercus suber]